MLAEWWRSTIKRKALWSGDEGIQWWFWYAIIKCHHLSPSWVLKYKKGWEGASLGGRRWPPRCPEQEWAMSTGQGVWQSLRSCYTDVYRYSYIDHCTEKFKAKIWLSWYPFKYEDSHQRVPPVCDLRGIWYTQLLSGDNCLFHLPDILEMPLVIVASESKADIRVVCLQPQAVIAGENFPRPWEVLGLSPPGGQRGLEKSLSGDKWDFCSVISTACCLLILEFFFLLPEFSCNCCRIRCLLHSFYFSRGEEQRGSVCLLHWPHPRCSLAVLVHADSREGADKQFHSVAHTWVFDAVWDAWVVQNTLMGWQTWCRACSKPIFFWLAAGNQVWCPMASQTVFVPVGE